MCSDIFNQKKKYMSVTLGKFVPIFAQKLKGESSAKRDEGTHLGFGFGICGKSLELPLRMLRLVANKINQRKVVKKHTQGNWVASEWFCNLSNLPMKGPKRRKRSLYRG